MKRRKRAGGDLERLRQRVGSRWNHLTTNEVDYMVVGSRQFMETLEKRCGLAHEGARQELTSMLLEAVQSQPLPESKERDSASAVLETALCRRAASGGAY